jgi:hypothetical protein
MGLLCFPYSATYSCANNIGAMSGFDNILIMGDLVKDLPYINDAILGLYIISW